MLNNILDIIKSILNHFFSKKEKEKLEEINKIEEKKQEVEFQSKVEEIAKQANSKNEEDRTKAIEEMRKLIAE